MKRIILLELCFLFLATTFQGDRLTGWVQQTIPRQDLPVVDLQFLDSLNGYFISTKPAVDTAFVFRTTDGGNNWITTYFESLYLDCMDFVNMNTGFCGGATTGSGILKKTTNGGNNWFTVSSIPFILIKDVEFINQDTGWICHSSGANGGLWRTVNGGLNWQMQMNDSYSPSKVFFVNSNTGWVIGNSGVNLYKSTNCGVNWNLKFHYSNTTEDVYFINQDTGYVTGGNGNGGLMRSTDGGNNWNFCNNLPIYQGARIFFATKNRGWVGNSFNKILVTNDGFNWGYQYSPGYSSYNVSFIDTLKGWAGYSGLVHTVDGGGPIVNVNQTVTEVPKDFVLEQNYPNPFNAISKIKYKISRSASADGSSINSVQIKVFDISGKEVAILVNERKGPGEYCVNFDGNNLASGIYFYALFADGKRIETKKAILIK